MKNRGNEEIISFAKQFYTQRYRLNSWTVAADKSLRSVKETIMFVNDVTSSFFPIKHMDEFYVENTQPTGINIYFYWCNAKI